MRLKSALKRFLNLSLSPVGYEITSSRGLTDYYLHEYESYEDYRDIQIFHNVRKLESIWADEKTLQRVCNVLNSHFPGQALIRGICHGARNGFEQDFLNQQSRRLRVIGTDISDTALGFENSVQWDYHDVRQEWLSQFDFVYSNSLDQSWQPKIAVETWLNQLQPDGLLIVEHTELHGPGGASEMDPFGVRPTVLPYVLAMWFGKQISIEHSVSRKANMDLDAWLFVVHKNVSVVKAI